MSTVSAKSDLRAAPTSAMSAKDGGYFRAAGGRYLARLSGVFLFALVWEFGARAMGSLFIPPLSEVLSHAWGSVSDGSVLAVVGPTLGRLIPALVLSLVAGIVLGTAIGLSQMIADVVYPVMQFIRAIPGAAKIPLFLVLLGFTDVIQMWVVAIVVIPPVVMNTYEGVRNVNPVLLDTCGVFRIKLSRRLFGVILPSAAPAAFAGIRIAGVISLIVTVVVEMLVGQDGLGNFVLDSERNFVFLDMWTGILLIAVLGWLINIVISVFEHFILAWHRGYRQSAA